MEIVDQEESIQGWFELSYAQYLTIPRSVLQSMPNEWQRRFVRCLQELDDAIDWRPKECRQYRVMLDKTEEVWDEDEEMFDQIWKNLDLHDPLMDYERGRRRIPHRTTNENSDPRNHL